MRSGWSSWRLQCKRPPLPDQSLSSDHNSSSTHCPAARDRTGPRGLFQGLAPGDRVWAHTAARSVSDDASSRAIGFLAERRRRMSRVEFTSPPRRILIIKPSAIGDVVHALPVLNLLRGRWPEARISWLVTPACVGL